MFTTEDLKTADRVVLRNGSVRIVLRGTSMGDTISELDGNGVVPLSAYGRDLRLRRDKVNEPDGEDLDIVEVLRPCKPTDMLDLSSNVVITVFKEAVA